MTRSTEATSARRRPKGSTGAAFSISTITEGPFKGKFTVHRGDVVAAIFGTKGAAKRYVEKAVALSEATSR